MKILFKILIISILCSPALYGNDTYPISYKLDKTFDGGHLYLLKMKDAGASERVRSLFVRPGWTGESERISIWDGIDKSKSYSSSKKETILSQINIEGIYSFGEFIFYVWKENEFIYGGILDTSLDITGAIEFTNSENNIVGNEIKFLPTANTKIKLILINEDLYTIEFTDNKEIDVKLISKNVKDFATFKNVNNNYYAYISEIGGWYEVYTGKIAEEVSLTARLQLSSEIKLFTGKELIYIFSSNKYSNHSWLHVIDRDGGIIEKEMINANINLLGLYHNNKDYIVFLNFKDEGYSYNVTVISNGSITESVSIGLPKELIAGKEIFIAGSEVFLLFGNGLISCDKSGEIKSIDYFPFGEYFVSISDLAVYKDYLILSSPSISLVFKRIYNDFWFVNSFLESTGKIIFPLLLIVILIVMFRRMRRQKRLLKAILEMPSAGVLFVLDKKGRLIESNDSGMKMLGISKEVPMKRVFRYYCDPDKTNALVEISDKALSLRDSFTQKIEIIDNNTVKEWFFSVIILRNIAGNFKGYVFTGIDITEELERKRLSNWAQLAHDMQTNLSTIRLNAEQIECGENEVNIRRKNKINTQVKLLIERIRDIVTVGRSGSPELGNYSAKDICLDVRNEFDELMFPNVKFELNIKDCMIYCDKAKIVRALRNAVENGIRAMNGNEGLISIGNWYDNRYFYFSVKDTGRGMTREQKEQMMTPYFTTSRSDGGMGIGTMIIQNVLEQHGGCLKIDSEPAKGTEVVFCIPVIYVRK
jgi:PAS domain S-box-containing protein